MGRICKSYPPLFKAKVALETIKDKRHPRRIGRRVSGSFVPDSELGSSCPEDLLDLFRDRRKRKEQDNETLIAEHYRQINRPRRPVYQLHLHGRAQR
jgi:hypothetical protein